MNDDDLRTLAAKADGPRWQECRVHYAMRVVGLESARLLRDALANPHAPHADLTRAINARIPATWATDESTVGRHRLGKCKCDRCGCGLCASMDAVA
jgi:hypothetical protein